MDSELKSLRIDRSKKRQQEGPSRWAKIWILTGIAIFLALGMWRFADATINRATEVEVVRVRAASTGAAAQTGDVILNATGYIIAAHKIQAAAKVVGKVSWIGVEKGDRVTQGQILVRLEDDEYRAQVQQAKGNLANLQARP